MPSQPTHPVVKAATAVLVVAAAAAGVLAGGLGRPEPVPVDTERFLPAVAAADTTPTDAATHDGAAVFQERCASCHTVGGGDREGPDLARAALRRDPLWVRAMIDRPDSMFAADSAARRLLVSHGIDSTEATAANPDLRALADFLGSFDPAR